MKKNEMKKIIVNGVVVAGICIGATGCETVEAKKDPIETTVSQTVESSDTILPETTPVVTETEKKEIEMTMEDLVALNEDFQQYLKNQTEAMVQDIDNDFGVDFIYEGTLTYLYLINVNHFSETEKNRLIESGLISEDSEILSKNLTDTVTSIGYYNGSYSLFSETLDQTVKKENYISVKDYVIDEEYKEKIASMDELLSGYGHSDCWALSQYLIEQNTLSGYEINDDSTATDLIIKQTYDYSIFMIIAQELEQQYIDMYGNVLNDDLHKTEEILFNKDVNSKQKVLVTE